MSLTKRHLGLLVTLAHSLEGSVDLAALDAIPIESIFRVLRGIEFSIY